MMYVPTGGARDVAATAGDLHAMIVFVPGGREGSARGGALPTRELSEREAVIANSAKSPPPAPQILPAAAARTFGPATIFADASTIHDQTLAASILRLPAGGQVAEHVHAHASELLYLLEGAGTMTVNGVALPVTPTSVVQIPPNTRHAFTATSAVRAVQVYTPGGPEQRFKAAP
jgi:quercetin dioxygenase-like cupin family protein